MTVTLDTEVTYCLPWCGGHYGKYDNCLTAALHETCSAMVGNADEETGDVESPYGYVWLVLGHDSIEIPAGEWSGDFDIKTMPGTFVLIRTNDQGRVWMESHDTADEAQAAFDEIDRLYGIWSEANDY